MESEECTPTNEKNSVSSKQEGVRLDETRRRNTDFLDGFRGIMVLSVLLSHFTLFTGPGMWYIFVPYGTTIGVHGLFILSSFLLTYNLLHELEKLNVIRAIIKYFIRRVFRIYPVFVTVVYLFAIQANQEIKIKDIFNLVNNRHLWTLYIQFISYMWIPVIAISTRFAGRYWPTIIVLLVSIAVYADQTWTYLRATGKIRYHGSEFSSWAPVFICGSIVGILYYHLEHRLQSVSEIIRQILDVYCFVTAIVFIVVTQPRWNSSPSIDYVSLGNKAGYYWTSVLMAMLVSRGQFCNLFSGRIWKHLAMVGYSMSLTHDFALRYLKLNMHYDLFTGFEGIFSVIMLSLIAATTMYYAIEKPFMILSNYVIKVMQMIEEYICIKILHWDIVQLLANKS